MKHLSLKTFKHLVDQGTLYKVSGKKRAGEELCENPFEHGIANGYPLTDICCFFARLRGHGREGNDEAMNSKALQDGYANFVMAVVETGMTLMAQSDSLVDGFLKAATEELKPVAKGEPKQVGYRR